MSLWKQKRRITPYERPQLHETIVYLSGCASIRALIQRARYGYVMLSRARQIAVG